eukprot:CAMPEP_0184864586 /NCGR_PEP_ID=MMETSP0580-20130426/15501_1 /TAXON_ID=1118495 /ORGANISM="Dactyliosolen fragilissimus" /LENGTH=520 /DNA_ID=CAMNT_0027363453 /DNA_START=8 /DNA_END=1570 /DNA_ORIENTATION=+
MEKGSVALLRFPAKVFETVNYCHENHPEVASWDESETSFLIKNRSTFEKEFLLGSYWGSPNGDILFESFQRQLNAYGFRKINSRKGGGKRDRSSKAQCVVLHYSHEYFCKGRNDLLDKIETSDVRSSLKKPRTVVDKGMKESDIKRVEKKIDELHEKFDHWLRQKFSRRQGLLSESTEEYRDRDRENIIYTEMKQSKTVKAYQQLPIETPSYFNDSHNIAMASAFENDENLLSEVKSDLEKTHNRYIDNEPNVARHENIRNFDNPFEGEDTQTTKNSSIFDLGSNDSLNFDEVFSDLETIESGGEKSRKRSCIPLASLVGIATVALLIGLLQYNNKVEFHKGNGTTDENTGVPIDRSNDDTFETFGDVPSPTALSPTVPAQTPTTLTDDEINMLGEGAEVLSLPTNPSQNTSSPSPTSSQSSIDSKNKRYDDMAKTYSMMTNAKCVNSFSEDGSFGSDNSEVLDTLSLSFCIKRCDKKKKCKGFYFNGKSKMCLLIASKSFAVMIDEMIDDFQVCGKVLY